MATRAIDDQHWTFEEYLDWEEQQPEKHELIDGEVVRKNREPLAMVGVTIRHGQTVTNIQSALKSKLRGSPCRAYGPEVRLHVSATGDSFYPDVFISCDRSAESEREVLDAAIVIMEVLSPSTAAYDSGTKMRVYIGLPSLLAYVLVDPDRHTIQTLTRENGCWILRDIAPDEPLLLPGAGVSLTHAEVFDDIDPPTAQFPPSAIVAPPPDVLRRRRPAPD